MISMDYNIDNTPYVHVDNIVQVGTFINYPQIKLPINFDYISYSQQTSNYDIRNDIKRLFKDESDIYNRFAEIFDDVDISQDKIQLNKQSFLSFHRMIDTVKKMFSSYVIGITNEGCVAIQYDDQNKYVYIKFFYEDNIFYNLYAKHNKVFDIVKTGIFSDLEMDYEKLCLIVT